MQRFAFIRLLPLLAALNPVHADERILSFHSDIFVNTDGGMQVVETITVRAEQDQIRRGIYRDFPTTYRDHLGNRYRVEFRVTRVLRDGVDENYFSRGQANGVRTYIGRENLILPPGEYTYTFSYRTARQLGFFDNHDELYWNVTGHDWEIPLDNVTATVSFFEPLSADQVRISCFTGPIGTRGRDFAGRLTHAVTPGRRGTSARRRC